LILNYVKNVIHS